MAEIIDLVGTRAIIANVNDPLHDLSAAVRELRTLVAILEDDPDHLALFRARMAGNLDVIGLAPALPRFPPPRRGPVLFDPRPRHI